MQTGAIQLLTNQFDALSQRTPDEDVEFWFARDLQEPLGYARWENFLTAIRRAIESCESTGYSPDDPSPLPKATLPSRPASRN